MKKNIFYTCIIMMQTISLLHSQDFTYDSEELEYYFIGNSEDTPYIAKNPANTTQREEEDLFHYEVEDQDE